MLNSLHVLVKKLNCVEKVCYSSALSENKDLATMHEKRLAVLREEMLSQIDDVTECMKETFAGLEYSVFVSCVFNERFMNKKQKNNFRKH